MVEGWKVEESIPETDAGALEPEEPDECEIRGSVRGRVADAKRAGQARTLDSTRAVSEPQKYASFHVTEAGVNRREAQAETKRREARIR